LNEPKNWEIKRDLSFEEGRKNNGEKGGISNGFFHPSEKSLYPLRFGGNGV